MAYSVAMKRLAKILAFFLGITPILAPREVKAVERKVAQVASFTKDLPYINDGTKEHRLDLFLPARTNPAMRVPLLVFIHGGAWRAGDKSEVANVGTAFSSRGIAVAAINYRLSSNPAVLHPMHIQDVAASIRFLLMSANQFGIDPIRIAIGGHSAGAHLSGLLSLDRRFLVAQRVNSAQICAWIGLEGIYHLKNFSGEGPAFGTNFVIPAFGSDENAWISASPQLIGSPLEPHTRWLVIHSRADELVKLSQSEQFLSHLQQLHIPSEKFMIDTLKHFEVVQKIGTPGDAVTDKITAFIQAACPVRGAGR